LNNTISSNQKNLLQSFADNIFKYNNKFNLTGHQTIEKIHTDLIMESIRPILELDVPRGTSFADMGTGSGIPGIPLAIILPHTSGILIDSNMKKINFINKFVKNSSISNIKALCGRIEELGHAVDLRESFDIVFSRAFNDIYITIELGASLVKENGFIYIYSNVKSNELCNEILNHIKKLGLSLELNHSEYNISDAGIILKKIAPLEEKYPRKFSVLKRESKKY
jgi:16S rRNA (guanine527-N7)-methyltransferase